MLKQTSVEVELIRPEIIMICEIILLDSHVSGSRGCNGRQRVKPDQDWMQPAVGISPAPNCGVIFFAGGEDKLESLQRKEFIGLSSAVGLEFSKREPGVSLNSSGIFLLHRDR